MARFENAIPFVLAHEGGFVDDSADPGGATNWGISLRFLAEIGDEDGDGFVDGDIDRDGDVDAADVRGLTRNQAATLYKAKFWDANRYGEIQSQVVATKLLDMAVNMGPKQAHKILQRALNMRGYGLVVDGAFGPKTLRSANQMPAGVLLMILRDGCIDFYEQLARRRPSLQKFLKGWLRRAAS